MSKHEIFQQDLTQMDLLGQLGRVSNSWGSPTISTMCTPSDFKTKPIRGDDQGATEHFARRFARVAPSFPSRGVRVARRDEAGDSTDGLSRPPHSHSIINEPSKLLIRNVFAASSQTFTVIFTVKVRSTSIGAGFRAVR
jgi:hypothetical protein